MTTTRQIERLWGAKTYNRLLGDLLVGRSENLPRVRTDVDARLASAAVGVIRLDEYNQSHTPFYGTLLRTILSAQQSDGGWGDPMTTALCLRALLCGRGNGLAVQRGCEALANLQKDDGSFPAEPFRRMPADAFVTAFVLYEVGDRDVVRTNVRLEEAYEWLGRYESTLDASTRVLWDRAKIRCRSLASATVVSRKEQVALWS
jgi:hypothetical protein